MVGLPGGADPHRGAQIELPRQQLDPRQPLNQETSTGWATPRCVAQPATRSADTGGSGVTERSFDIDGVFDDDYLYFYSERLGEDSRPHVRPEYRVAGHHEERLAPAVNGADAFAADART